MKPQTTLKQFRDDYQCGNWDGEESPNEIASFILDVWAAEITDSGDVFVFLSSDGSNGRWLSDYELERLITNLKTENHLEGN